jgi:hypothetical protein
VYKREKQRIERNAAAEEAAKNAVPEQMTPMQRASSFINEHESEEPQ